MKFVADYGVTFPLTEKVDVNGDGACDVFKWLKEATPGSENADIEWNFVKVRLHVCWLCATHCGLPPRCHTYVRHVWVCGPLFYLPRARLTRLHGRSVVDERCSFL